MKNKVILTAALAATCLVAADTVPQFKAKLGVWEVTTTMQVSGMPSGPSAPSIPADKLAQMPPAQRAQIEAMIKQRSGGSPVTRTTQTCVTPEKLSKGPFSEERASCQRTIVSSTAKTMQVHEVCTESDGSQRTTDAKYEVIDDASMKGSIKSTGTTNGRPINLNVDVAGKWVGSDCSTIKK